MKGTCSVGVGRYNVVDKRFTFASFLANLKSKLINVTLSKL